MTDDVMPDHDELPHDISDFGFNGVQDDSHLLAAPAISLQDLQEMASHSEAIEQDEQFNYFDYDFEQVTEPEPEHVKVPEQETYLEEWQQLLIDARNSRMNKVAGGSFIINGLVQGGESGLLYGESGAKKTFLAIHMGMCVAKGMPCFGKGVRQGLVYYFAAEDPAGVRERIMGWEEHYNGGMPVPQMQMVPHSFNLLDKEHQDKFCGAVENIFKGMPKDQRKVSMIVIDTLSTNNTAMTLGGKPLDENSNNDMAAMLTAANTLARRLGCALLFIHHSGKDSEKGARGASALRANVGFEIKARGIKGQSGVIIEPTKIKMAAMLPKRKVTFAAQKLPEIILQEREAAGAELCDDEEAGWSTEQYDTTLVPKNHLQPVEEADEEQPTDNAKSAISNKALPSHAEIALFVRKHGGNDGLDEDSIIANMLREGKIPDRQRVKRGLKAAVDRHWLMVTSEGRYRHNQEGGRDFFQQHGFTAAWNSGD